MRDFDHVTRSERMDWARQFSAIEGLKELDVIASLKHCPPPRATDMAFFSTFSASIETGFVPYLKHVMLDQSS